MSCVLRAAGSPEAVDEFLSHSRLEIYKSWRRGEPVSAGSGRRHARCGFSILVSGAEFDELSLQIEDAVKYLQTNRPELARLEPLSIGAELDFAILERDVAVQSDSLPPLLLRLAGSLSITLSRYPARPKRLRSEAEARRASPSTCEATGQPSKSSTEASSPWSMASHIPRD